MVKPISQETAKSHTGLRRDFGVWVWFMLSGADVVNYVYRDLL